MTDKPTNFQKDYSEDGFGDKCKKYAVTAGKEAMELALKMYYSARDPDTPSPHRCVIATVYHSGSEQEMAL